MPDEQRGSSTSDSRDNTIIVVGLVALLLFVLFGGVLVSMGMMWPGMMRPGMMWRFDGGAFNLWWGLVMMLIWPLLILGAIVLIVWLARRPGAAGPLGGAESRADRALEILRERYARGEIDREQYEQIRRDLS